MKFNYKGRNKAGKIETGSIEASSTEAAILLLQKYNIFVTSLEEQGKKFIFKNIRIEGKVSKKDLAVFFRQLSVMLESRVPVVQSLTSLASQTKKVKFKDVILKVSTLVEEGVPLSDAFAAYPVVFNNFTVNLIRSGEASGNISKAMFYISDHLERESDIIGQIKQAMVYPAFVLCVMVVVIAVIIIEVVPKISDLIKQTTAAPPLFTVLMLNFYAFLAKYWWLVLIGLAFIVILTIYYLNTKKGKERFSIVSLKIPVVGGLLKKVFVSRFCDNIATLISAGISINKALKITEDTVNNVIYKRLIAEIGKGVSEGEKMSSIMIQHTDYFPNFVVQMIQVGESTGKLDKTLMEVVNFYEKDVKKTLDLLASLIEPVMIIVLGLIVAGIAVSVLEPLYSSLGTL